MPDLLRYSIDSLPTHGCRNNFAAWRHGLRKVAERLVLTFYVTNTVQYLQMGLFLDIFISDGSFHAYKLMEGIRNEIKLESGVNLSESELSKLLSK